MQQGLALHRQQRLGSGVGQRAHALAPACGPQHRRDLPRRRARVHWRTFGCGMSVFGRPGDDKWSTFAFGCGMSAFGRPGGDRWRTFAFGCGMSAFGRPGGAHGRAPRCSAWRNTVVAPDRAGKASRSGCALPEWSAPKLHTCTSSVAARCSGQVCAHRCDCASVPGPARMWRGGRGAPGAGGGAWGVGGDTSSTVAVTPPRPCAVAANPWNNWPTGCNPAARAASMQAPPSRGASGSHACARRQPWRSAVRCSPCMACNTRASPAHRRSAPALQPALKCRVFPAHQSPMANIQPHPQMANAIRALAMDAVQQANSGHPGAPMGMADMAVALWGQHLKHNPADPRWFDRDRFVLSNGHGSMLLYALLHLTGYDLSIDELKNFRQLHSKTAGHPEVGLTPGVETTTGPLGQGIANAVGFALAEKLLAAELNRAGHVVVDHHSYVFLGHASLMEGVSHEAVALAGVWKLHKLIALSDDNGISIDGQVTPWFADNTPLRFVACGWNVIGPIDGHDADKVASAIAEAKKQTERPALIVCKTRIGQGSPNRANSAKAHAEPLGAEEVALARADLGWTSAPFVVEPDIYAAWDGRAKGQSAQAQWNERFAAYGQAFPALAAEFRRRMQGQLPAHFEPLAAGIERAADGKRETVASRRASQLALQAFTAQLHELLRSST